MIQIKTFPMGSIGTNCYLVYSETTAVLIDCDGDPTGLFHFLQEKNLKLSAILLTHGHFDHIGAVAEVKEKFSCPVYAGAEEAPLLADPALNYSCFCGAPVTVVPDVLLHDGETFTIGSLHFQVIFTPGHTQGSVCYLLEDILFSGDTLFQGSCGRTDLPTGDWQQIRASLQKLSQIPGNKTVYPGHGPATTLDEERQNNPFF